MTIFLSLAVRQGLPFIPPRRERQPLRVSVGATAYVKRLSRHNRCRFYSTFRLTTPYALRDFGSTCPEVKACQILFLVRGRGRGGRATVKILSIAQCSGAGFAVQWTGRRRGQDLSCSPLSVRTYNGKNPGCQGFKGGDFFAAYKRKNTTRPLTARIGVAAVTG